MITRVLLAAVLFYVVSNPATYKLVESLLGRFFKIAMNGSPTPVGLVVHTAVFAALFYLLAPMVSQEGYAGPEYIKGDMMKSEAVARLIGKWKIPEKSAIDFVKRSSDEEITYAIIHGKPMPKPQPQPTTMTIPNTQYIPGDPNKSRAVAMIIQKWKVPGSWVIDYVKKGSSQEIVYALENGKPMPK